MFWSKLYRKSDARCNDGQDKTDRMYYQTHGFLKAEIDEPAGSNH